MNTNKESSYEVISITEKMNQLKKKKLLWENYYQLVSNKKIQYNLNEIKLIKYLLYNPMPKNYRRNYWIIISGARRSMLNNKNYYKNLLSSIPKNFLYEETINLDLHRTFPELKYFNEPENIRKLKNILMAFSLRNNTIGYCQGFNFIVAKLLYVINDEEETFWVFTNIIENYLPSDFYINFFGVKNDIEIIKKIIMNYYTDIKGEILDYLLPNLITKCFISLYSQNIRGELLEIIWDSFFVYGNIVLYKTFIYIVNSLFQKEISKNKNKSFESLNNSINEGISKLDDKFSLNYFLFNYNGINQKNLDIYRNQKKEERLKIGLNISLYSYKIICDKNLPYCKKFIEIQNPEEFRYYIIYKTNKKLKIINNYFFSNLENKCIENNLDNNKNLLDDLLIERHKHICN